MGRVDCKECGVAIDMSLYHQKRGWYVCMACHRKGRQAWYLRNKKTRRAYANAYKRQQRERVLKHYGGACACCGETLYEFLSLDHMDGGGNRHRTRAKIASMAQWLLANNLPSGYQVLCHNCNLAKGFYGKCPHQV